MITNVVMVAEYAATADLSDHQEVRGRVTGSSGQSAALGLDFLNAPSARLRIYDRRWDATLGYSPSITVPDVQLGVTAQVSHNGVAAVSWRERRVLLTLTESGSYGQQNSAFLTTPATQAAGTAAGAGTGAAPPTPTPVGGAAAGGTVAPGAVQLLPAPTTLLLGSSRTTFGAQLRVAHRWQASTALSYALSGGLDAASRVTLPLQKGPRAEASVEYAASHVDALVTAASATKLDFSTGACPVAPGAAAPPAGVLCSPEDELVQATESWRRRLTRSSNVSVGVGGSLVRSRLQPSDPTRTFAYPVGEVSYEYATSIETHPTRIRVDGIVAPVVDVRSGATDYRAQGAVTITLPIRRTTFRGVFAATRSVYTIQVEAASLVRADGEVEYRVSPLLSVGGGLRYAWQQQGVGGAFSTGIAFLQATVRAPLLRF